MSSNYYDYTSVELDFIREGNVLLIIDKNKTYNNCSKVTSKIKADKIEDILKPLILENKITIKDIIEQDVNKDLKVNTILKDNNINFQLKFHISQPRYQDRKKVESVIRQYNIDKGNLREYKDKYKSNNSSIKKQEVCNIPIRVNTKTVIYVKESKIFSRKYLEMVGSFNELLERVINQKMKKDWTI